MDMEHLNRISQKILRLGSAKATELSALARKQRFYCSALSGLSSYNICVNCDMTVSCNCQDFDGSGQIGDLNTQSLEEVFGSSKAIEFRKHLASGRLPIPTCAVCSELKVVSAEEASYQADNWNVPKKGIMVENTIACPYRYLACSRTVVRHIRKSTHMTLSDTRKISLILLKHNIECLSYFNLGETFAASDVLEHLCIIRETNPDLNILISTNGFLLNQDSKREAALLANHIWFSIDGIDDRTMSIYQRGASFSKVYGNMINLIEYRNLRGKTNPTIEWKYVLFNWNDREPMILKAVEKAERAGVDAISFWPTKSPFYGISWRYHLKSFYKRLGEPCWMGRQISFFRSVPCELDSSDKSTSTPSCNDKEFLPDVKEQ